MSPQNLRVRPFACTLPHNALEPDLWAAWGMSETFCFIFDRQERH